MIAEKRLRNELLHALTKQGFKYNPHLRPKNNSKNGIRTIHKYSRIEKLRLHSNFLIDTKKTVKDYAIDGSELNPEEIQLELRQVEPNSLESEIFLWWNLAWWSVPYEHPIGRQMRYIIWDKTHDSPFGLIGLQSPPLKISVRDKYLGIPNEELDYWLNMSLYGQRVGALPPYNDLLGGKLVAMALTSNEIREDYSKKYHGRKTLMNKRVMPAKLLFVTTTSAYGRSSMYERIRYYDETIGEFLGFTAGAGTFYIPDKLYPKLLKYLKSLGYDAQRGYGTGPSRKLKFIDIALRKLGIKRSARYGIKRGFYLFSHVANIKQVIKENSRPRWYDRPFDKMQDFWLERYAIPRAERKQDFRKFKFNRFSDSVIRSIN